MNAPILFVGAAETVITPAVGTGMVGSLVPRPSKGVDDPLLAKAIVLEGGGERLAVVVLDLATLPRCTGDACVRLAAQRTGIPEDRIVWAATHTHTGPIAEAEVYLEGATAADLQWRQGLPEQFAQAVVQADRAKQPARLSHCRGYCEGVAASRRLRYKDGHDRNSWMLPRGEVGTQSLGYASLSDPEVNVLCFDDVQGTPLAVLWHFSCHTNANFGSRFSADYPAVTAARLRERYGAKVVSIFVPGASGDVNPLVRWRELGNRLADEIIGLLDKRQVSDGPVAIRAVKQEVVVPARAFRPDEEARRRTSGWSEELQKWFAASEAFLRQRGQTDIATLVQAWRIGEVAFASVPGELFVEWGLAMKSASPFPWTCPVELGGDYIGYLVTEAAEQGGGYEPLHSWVSQTGVEGTRKLVEAAQGLLQQLWQRDRG
jgi:hypothetical protein